MIPETLTAEDFAKVPEKFRDLYTEKDGAYVLDALPRRVAHTAINAKREAEQRATKTASAYDGLDPEEVKSAVELKRSLEQQELLKKGDVEGLIERERKKLTGAAEKQRQELEAKLNATNAQLARMLRDDAITKAALAVGVLPDALDMVQMSAERALQVVDGRVVDGEGAEVDVTKWVKEFTAKRKYLMGETTGGGTAKGSNAAAPAAKPRSKMSHEEKAAYQTKHGMDAYNKLPA